MNRLAHYIAQQPEVVHRCWAFAQTAFEAVAGRAPRRIALVGSGSSFNVLLCCEPAFRALLDDVRLFNPLDFIDGVKAGRARFDQVAVLSQSGASQTSIDAARTSVEAGLPTLILTADANSAIIQSGAEIVVMPIGIESVGPKTMGYTGSLAVLLGLARTLGLTAEFDSKMVGQAVADTLATVAQPIAILAASLASANHIVFAARGRHLGTATEAALKIAEIVGVPTAAFPLEELLHGRLHMLHKDSACIILADTTQDFEIARHTIAVLRELSIPGWMVDLTPSYSGTDRSDDVISLESTLTKTSLDVIPAILPFQLLANSMALSRNLDPAAMTYPDMSRRLNLKRIAQ